MACLSLSLAPAPGTSDELEQEAVAQARTIAEQLDYVGVFALELFVQGSELLGNEMAPRVHNSGHWTIEGAHTSQFENHIRAVLGLPLGDTGVRGASAMLNWIGEMPDPAPVLAAGRWPLARLRQGGPPGPQGGPRDDLRHRRGQPAERSWWRWAPR